MCALLRSLFFAVPYTLATAACGQMNTDAGTHLTLDPGTSLRVDANTTWNIASGAVVTNNGTIVLGPSAVVNEAPGSPIDGSGTERITRTVSAPPSGEDLGGLGCRVTADVALGNTTLERGHLSFTDYSGHVSVERWYRFQPAVNSAMNATIDLGYDPTELGGLNEVDLVAHVRATVDVWNFLAGTVNTVTHRITSTGLDSLGTFTAFEGDLPNNVSEAATAPAYWLSTAGDGESALHWTGAEALRSIVLLDASGRVVNTWQGNFTGGLFDLRTASLARGTYLVRVNGTHTIPFVR